MKQGKLFGILVLSLLMVVSVATDAMGQGRGRRTSRRSDDKKCSKFVNCHDARDGRWDGRGPERRSRFSNNFRRRRNRDRDFEDIRWRRRNRDRDFDDDRFWRRRR